MSVASTDNHFRLRFLNNAKHLDMLLKSYRAEIKIALLLSRFMLPPSRVLFFYIISKSILILCIKSQRFLNVAKVSQKFQNKASQLYDFHISLIYMTKKGGKSMSKSEVVPETTGRISYKELKQVIKLGLVQGNLIPAFAGAWLAIVMTHHGFLASMPQLIIMMIGSTLVMGGSCAINNYYDQDIDALMPSKQNRPTVNDRISDRQLVILSLGMMVVGELLLFMINVPAGVIGLAGIIGYVSFYSIWSKRHTTWNTVIGSFPGAVPPLIGWVAIEGHLSVMALALFAVVFAWQPIHFYALAIKRRDEYRLANVPMLPSVKSFNRTRIGMFLWLFALLPLPFVMHELGITFIVLATLLNLGWIALGLTSFKASSNEEKWATKMFIYSLNYLVVFFALVVVISLINMI